LRFGSEHQCLLVDGIGDRIQEGSCRWVGIAHLMANAPNSGEHYRDPVGDHIHRRSGAPLAGAQSWNHRRYLGDDQPPRVVSVKAPQYVGDGVSGLAGRLNDGLELSLKTSESRTHEMRVRFHTLDVEVEELAEDGL
jgi:hypothetical protein